MGIKKEKKTRCLVYISEEFVFLSCFRLRLGCAKDLCCHLFAVVVDVVTELA